ncbi:MAG: murein L,D-transpeptidase [Desulfopila sp.]
MKRKSVLFSYMFTITGLLMLMHLPALAEEKSFQEECMELLDEGPARYLHLQTHGSSADEIDSLLADIYHAHSLQPYWLDEKGPNERAKAILATLDDAARQGLNPRDYFITKIKHYWQRRDVAGLVRLDILLSLGMMRYTADQRQGRLEVHDIDPQLFATARSAKVDWRHLFQEAFTTKDMRQFLGQQAPPFAQYASLMNKLAEYRVLAAKGGWERIAPGQVIRPGMTDSRIPALRQRLAVSGEYTAPPAAANVYDSTLVLAIKRFQQHHGLEQDGIIGPHTLAAMNVSAEKRVQQIIVNMERYRWLDRSALHNRQVVVNIAGFTAAGVDREKVELSMPVVVGEAYQQTPVFDDTITYVELNPYWTVPPSIASKETLPKLRKNPHYLVQRKMRLFSGWGEESKELDSTTINWSAVSPERMRQYRIRQDPGPGNDLGRLKIMFPNPYNVYLHDTPHRNLFARDKRAFSHGCIRLGKPVQLASWVLGGAEAGWSAERLNELIATEKRRVITLATPVPVHILYRTAVVEEDGSIIFYDDIYDRDRLIGKALFGSR